MRRYLISVMLVLFGLASLGAYAQNQTSIGQVGPRGWTGARGPAGTIDINQVTTVPPGTSASVTNVGTATNAEWNIAIPRGSAIYSGSGAPSSSIGLSQDWYINTQTPCLYGPKTNDNIWPTTCIPLGIVDSSGNPITINTDVIPSDEFGVPAYNNNNEVVADNSFLNSNSAPNATHTSPIGPVTAYSITGDDYTGTFTATNSLTAGQWVWIQSFETGAPCYANLDFTFVQVISATSTSFTAEDPYNNACSSTTTIYKSNMWGADGTATSISEDSNNNITVTLSAPVPSGVMVGDIWSLPDNESLCQETNLQASITSISGNSFTTKDLDGCGALAATAINDAFAYNRNQGLTSFSNGVSFFENGPIQATSYGPSSFSSLIATGPTNSATGAGPSFSIGALSDNSNTSNSGMALIDGEPDDAPFYNEGIDSWRMHIDVDDVVDNINEGMEIDAYPNGAGGDEPGIDIFQPTNSCFTFLAGAVPSGYTGKACINTDGIIGNSSPGTTVYLPNATGYWGILSGTLTPGDCVKFDPTGTFLVDSGVQCTASPVTLSVGSSWGTVACATGYNCTSHSGTVVITTASTAPTSWVNFLSVSWATPMNKNANCNIITGKQGTSDIGAGSLYVSSSSTTGVVFVGSGGFAPASSTIYLSYICTD